MASLKSKSIPQKQVPETVALPLSLLQEAHNIIHGDREQTYGAPEKNLNNIAAYWSIHLSASCGENISLTAHDVCVMMILLKQARLANTPGHKDSLVDTAGYAGLADLVFQRDNQIHVGSKL